MSVKVIDVRAIHNSIHETSEENKLFKKEFLFPNHLLPYFHQKVLITKEFEKQLNNLWTI